jgi:hypothetical protein
VKATGTLVSTGTVIANPLPANLASVELGAEQPKGEWNPATLKFDAVPTPREPLLPLDFIRKFTMQEEGAIRTKARTDAMVEVFLSRLNAAQVVHLENPETIAGVNYCVSIGAITAERGAVILNG